MRILDIKKDAQGECHIDIQYTTNNFKGCNIAIAIYIQKDNLAGIYMSVFNGSRMIFSIGFHDINLLNMFPTLEKMENIAREQCSEAKEILSDLIPPES